jgi:hypothetical protein
LGASAGFSACFNVDQRTLAAQGVSLPDESSAITSGI